MSLARRLNEFDRDWVVPRPIQERSSSVRIVAKNLALESPSIVATRASVLTFPLFLLCALNAADGRKLESSGIVVRLVGKERLRDDNVSGFLLWGTHGRCNNVQLTV